MFRPQLTKFSLSLYVYTLFIILWGAWVRISKSGDGCGDSWPLCDGALIPKAQSWATWFEYFHRFTTGLFGLLVIYLFYIGLKHYRKETAVWRLCILIFVFTVIEALIGALLVKLGLVVDNDTFLRLLYMSIHQVSSILLSGFIGLLWLISKRQKYVLDFHRSHILIAAAFLLLMLSGPLAALSTTLYPSQELWQGFLQDLQPGQHWIIRWRGLHPILSSIIGAAMVYLVYLRYQKTKDKKYETFLKILVIALLFGVSTLLMLYPIWMKLGHLALAHLLWLAVMRLLIKDKL